MKGPRKCKLGGVILIILYSKEGYFQVFDMLSRTCKFKVTTQADSKFENVNDGSSLVDNPKNF